MLGAQPDDARETGGDADVTCEHESVRDDVSAKPRETGFSWSVVCSKPHAISYFYLIKNALSSDFYDIIKSFYIP